MKTKFTLLFLLITFFSCQKENIEDYSLAIQNYQSDLIAFYNSSESPIKIENKKKFNGLTFFPINEKYRVKASFIPSEKDELVEFKTSSEEKRNYKRYGKLVFRLDEKELQLTVFNEVTEGKKNENHLFVPFTDKTSGLTSYGGGRYLDLDRKEIKSDNTVEIDFNKSYNPYCAYEEDYSCAIPPKENRLEVNIEAGVSYLGVSH